MSMDHKHNPLKGALLGLIAGGVGGAAMDGYWAIVEKVPGARPEQKPKPGDDRQEKEEPSTQIIADKISEALTGKEIPKKDKPIAGIGVHYGTSLICGVPYGVIAARRPKFGILGGALYGAAIWLFLDEIALRALNMAPDPESVSTSDHVKSLGAHLVFGSAIGLLTRIFMR